MIFSIRSRKSFKDNDSYMVLEEETNEEYYNDLKKYRSSTSPQETWLNNLQDRFYMGGLSVLGFYLRTKKLSQTNFIIDIELEITQQINWYMQGKFFIGKFPPLPSLVGTFVARIAGYYGNEDLVYNGQPFKHFPVTALRRLSSLLGTALIPLCYMTLRNMGHSRSTAILASALLVFENGIITQSRHIMPDVYALFFSAAATCSWSFMNKFMQESNQESNFKSRIWNIITGLCIGCSMSSKWSGAMALPVIWASIIYEMFIKLSEKETNVMNTIKKFMVYTFTVGFLPFFVYYTIFRFHLSLIPNSGDHDLLLSSEFKFSLIGNNFEMTQSKVAYGSSLVIKHRYTGGGYLHSHKKHYTTGSKQQQVSTYPYVDINNIWTIHKPKSLANTSAPIEYVKNQDRIRLEHFASSRKLHSHDHRSAISTRKEYFEVSAYGDKFISDNNDYWTLNILDETGNIITDKDIIFRPLVHNFRLSHIRGCVLVSVEAYLPESKQQEVACMSSAAKHVYSWVVESAIHPQEMDEPNITIKKLDMYEKLKEAHWLMYAYPQKIHNRLRDDTKSSIEGSPLSWFVRRHAMKLWNKLTSHSFIVINPALQRLTLASLVSVVGFLGLKSLYEKRQAQIPTFFTMPKSSFIDANGYIRSIIFFYGATMIHTMLLGIVPSYSISFTDVLPSFYYGAGLISVILELSTLRLNPVVRRAITYGAIFFSAFSFLRFSHFVYQNQTWTRTDCENAGLGSIDCLEFTPSNMDESSNGMITTSYQLPDDKIENFRYALGDEVNADQNVGLIRQKKYMEAHDEITWRYHRVIPTPEISLEEAEQWAADVYNGAKKREEKNLLEAKKKAEEDLKKKEAENEKKKKEDEANKLKEKMEQEKEKLQEAEKSRLQEMTKVQQEKTKGSKKTARDNAKNKQNMPHTQVPVAEPVA